MLKALLSLALLAGGSAMASELDDENSVTNQGLKGTVVVRVDHRNNSVSYLKQDGIVSSPAQAKTVAKSGRFSKMPAAKVTNELDRDGGASSWYWYHSPYNYGSNYLSWYGYQYQSYYTYNYSYYSYYYYNRWNNWGYPGYGYGYPGYGYGGW